MSEDSTKYYIVQFSTTGQKIRLVKKAYFDGYTISNRFLKGCMFEVSLDENDKIVVRADDDCRGYLESNEVDVTKWEKRVLKHIQQNNGWDSHLQGDYNDPTWDDRELHLNDNLDFYFEDGFELVE